MSGFLLSPGITPELTDLFVLEFPIAAGLAYAAFKGRGFETALALNTLALGLIKLVTDYADLEDLPVAFAGIFGGLSVLLWALAPGRVPGPKGAGWLVAAVLFVLVGLAKAGLDFYDPFDLLLADLAIVAGGLVLAHRHARRHATGDSPGADRAGPGTDSL